MNVVKAIGQLYW